VVIPGRLVVLYDGDCPICRHARSWLFMQPQLVPLEFEKAGSAAARRRFPGLDHRATLRDITVVADTGAVYVGDAAWLICLWALDSYRPLSIRLAQPGLRGAAREVVAMASATRTWLKKDDYGDGCEATACATR
jgi:predicted DCC family thiol-disulfide oxidoreductase YuxK